MKVKELQNMLATFDGDAEVTLCHSFNSDEGYESEFYGIAPGNSCPGDVNPGVADQCGGEVYIRIKKH